MEYKIGKMHISTLLLIVLGIQLVSIITNIISLCASIWIVPHSLFLTYNNKSLDNLYDDCKSNLDSYEVDYCDDYYCDDDEREYYDWLKEYCSILKISKGVRITYTVLVVISMALMAAWMLIIVKTLQGKFHHAFGVVLGVISAIFQIVAIIQYTSLNQISFDNIYRDYDGIETSGYFGQAGDGPKLSVVVCVIDCLLVLALIFIQVKIRKLRSQ